MFKTNHDPHTQEAFKQYQEKKKAFQQYDEKRRKQAEQNTFEQLFAPTSAPQTQPQTLTQRLTQQQTQKILANLDIHRPPQTWTSTITHETIAPFYHMINQLSKNLSKPIWEKFTSEPLKLNPYFLKPEKLIEKNRAIIETRKGTLLFNDLVTKLYLSSLPEDFRLKFRAHNRQNEDIFGGFIMWSIFALLIIKLKINNQWSRISRINYLWPKSLTLVAGIYFGMNRYFEWSDSKFAQENVEIVQTCVDTHLRFLEAHGTDLDSTFKKFLKNEKAI